MSEKPVVRRSGSREPSRLWSRTEPSLASGQTGLWSAGPLPVRARVGELYRPVAPAHPRVLCCLYGGETRGTLSVYRAGEQTLG